MTTAAAPVARRRVEITRIGPNSQPQYHFLSSRAQIVIGGGAAGGGKTQCLLMDPLRYIEGIHRADGSWAAPPVPGFTAVIFRRVSPMITNEGGLWDSSVKLYGQLPTANPIPGNLEWRWPADARGVMSTIRFAHMQHEKNMFDWQGSQIPWLGWDELTHFEEEMFFYMLSRNRSDTGIVGQMRAGTNPEPGWVADLLDWWIDDREEVKNDAGVYVENPQYGLPYPERSGVVRYFIRDKGVIRWADTRRELADALRVEYPTGLPGGISAETAVKSLTFVPFKAESNVDLLRNDPSYIANLMALPLIQRARLLGGNWKVKPEAGKIFNRSDARIVPAIAYGETVVGRVRYWDKAATEGGGDWSVGTRMARMADGTYVIEHVVREQVSTSKREQLIYQTAQTDGTSIPVVVEQEPGSGGKDSAYLTITGLAGWIVDRDLPSGPLDVRARALASQWQVGNVKLVAGQWNRDLLDEFHAFTGESSNTDDQVASASGAFNWLLKNAQNLTPQRWPTIRG